MGGSVLIVDDEAKMGKALRHVLVKEGHTVDATDRPEEALELLEQHSYEVMLCDLKMPGMSGLDVLERSRSLQPDLSVIMMTAYASAETAVEAMKLGAYDYLIKPFSTDELKILVARCLDTNSLKRENVALREQLADRGTPPEIVAVSESMEAVLRRARKVAPAAATVLITGESGTGKEMVAGLIHRASPRTKGPLITVNCGALTESLLESELFGHRKGAFTGAVEDRMGMFEAASGGTLFLDEIGEVSPALQVKLLRVLQSGQIQKVGDPAPRQVDVRIVAATNRDLEAMVETGEFRKDLFYRLNVVPIHIPPLRERREDIAPLVAHMLERHGGAAKRRFSSGAMWRLEAWDWPGNVRELENAVEHAVVLGDGEELDIEDLPAAIADSPAKPAEGGGLRENMTLEEAEKHLIQVAMERSDDNMTRAARELGVTRRTLGYRLRKYGLYRAEHGDVDDDPESDGEEEV